MIEIVKCIFNRNRARQGEVIDPQTPRIVRLTSQQADEIVANGETNSFIRGLPSGSEVMIEEQGRHFYINRPPRRNLSTIITGVFHRIEKNPSKLIPPKV